MNIILTALLVALSGLFYRFGGMSNDEPPAWIPKWIRIRRVWICPIFGFGSLLLWWQPTTLLGWLMFIPAYGLSGGALSTYWDELFGYDNFYMHGFMCGLASFPLIWAGLAWWMVLAGAVFGGLAMGLLCQFTKNVWVEECGRGIIFALSKII